MFDIIEMSKESISDIMEVEKESFLKPWSEKMFENELENDKAMYFAAVDESGTAVAYGGFWIVCDEAQITNIAVHPKCRRCGIGEAILKKMIYTAKEKDAQTMMLEVRVSNEPAKLLYKKLGFKEDGIRKRYYSDAEDALLMTKKLR